MHTTECNERWIAGIHSEHGECEKCDDNNKNIAAFDFLKRFKIDELNAAILAWISQL